MCPYERSSLHNTTHKNVPRTDDALYFEWMYSFSITINDYTFYKIIAISVMQKYVCVFMNEYKKASHANNRILSMKPSIHHYGSPTFRLLDVKWSTLLFQSRSWTKVVRFYRVCHVWDLNWQNFHDLELLCRQHHSY